jgi:hypothetical protein
MADDVKVTCNKCQVTMRWSALQKHKCVGWQRFGYICGIDYASELGCNPTGNKIFPTVAALRGEMKCARPTKGKDRCAIVRVKITVDKIVQKGMML